jgi:hypothetical protein
MNNSTENVTLLAAFVNDVLKHYEDKKYDYPELFLMTKGYNLSDPQKLVPIQLYNDLCSWIELNLGKYNLIRIGRQIGETVFELMLSMNLYKPDPKPIDVMNALKVVADNAIQDPEKRGWEIVSSKEKSIVMKRTQTFNSKLQLGLIVGLLGKSNAAGVKVDFIAEVANGAEFDEYLITWI